MYLSGMYRLSKHSDPFLIRDTSIECHVVQPCDEMIQLLNIRLCRALFECYSPTYKVFVGIWIRIHLPMY